MSDKIRNIKYIHFEGIDELKKPEGMSDDEFHGLLVNTQTYFAETKLREAEEISSICEKWLQMSEYKRHILSVIKSIPLIIGIITIYTTTHIHSLSNGFFNIEYDLTFLLTGLGFIVTSILAFLTNNDELFDQIIISNSYSVKTIAEMEKSEADRQFMIEQIRQLHKKIDLLSADAGVNRSNPSISDQIKENISCEVIMPKPEVEIK